MGGTIRSVPDFIKALKGLQRWEQMDKIWMSASIIGQWISRDDLMKAIDDLEDGWQEEDD